jgi:hypothetical protein
MRFFTISIVSTLLLFHLLTTTYAQRVRETDRALGGYAGFGLGNIYGSVFKTEHGKPGLSFSAGCTFWVAINDYWSWDSRFGFARTTQRMDFPVLALMPPKTTISAGVGNINERLDQINANFYLNRFFNSVYDKTRFYASWGLGTGVGFGQGYTVVNKELANQYNQPTKSFSYMDQYQFHITGGYGAGAAFNLAPHLLARTELRFTHTLLAWTSAGDSPTPTVLPNDMAPFGTNNYQFIFTLAKEF